VFERLWSAASCRMSIKEIVKLSLSLLSAVCPPLFFSPSLPPFTLPLTIDPRMKRVGEKKDGSR